MKEKKKEKQNLTENSSNISYKYDKLLNIRENILKDQCIRSRFEWIDEGKSLLNYCIQENIHPCFIFAYFALVVIGRI